MPYKMLSEDDDKFVLEHKDGSKFEIAKGAVGSDYHEKVRNMKNFSDGGVVENPDPGYAADDLGWMFGMDKKSQADRASAGVEANALAMASLPKSPDELVNNPAPVVAESQPQQTVEVPAAAPVQGPQQPQQAQTVAPVAPGFDPNKYVENSASAIQDIAVSKAIQSDQIAKAYEQHQKQLAEEAARYQVQNNEIEAERQQLAKAVMDGKLDPNRAWNDRSTGAKVSAGIAMILGGMASGLTGRQNIAFKVLDDQINRDIESQKQDISNKGTLYNMNLQRYKDANMAHNATLLQMNTMLQSKIAVAAARAGTPQALAQGKLAIQQLGLQGEALKAQLAQQRMMSQPISPDTNPEALPEKMRERFVPGIGLARTNESAKELEKTANAVKSSNQSIDELINMSKTGSSLSMEDRDKAEVLANLLQGSLREIIVGPGAVSDTERAMLVKAISNPMEFTTSSARARTRLEELKKVLNRKLDSAAQLSGARPSGIKFTPKE